MKEVVGGYECGLNIHGFNDIKEGDIVEGYPGIRSEEDSIGYSRSILFGD